MTIAIVYIATDFFTFHLLHDEAVGARAGVVHVQVIACAESTTSMARAVINGHASMDHGVQTVPEALGIKELNGVKAITRETL